MSCKRKISQVQKHPGKGGMFFCPLPGCLRFLPGFTGNFRYIPENPRFFYFSGCVQAFNWYTLKSVCTKADNEMHDRKKHGK